MGPGCTYGVSVQPVTAEGRVAVWAARSLAIAAVLLALTAVALPVLSKLPYLHHLFGSPEVVVALSYSVTGAFLVHEPRARSMGWLLLGIGVLSAVYVVSLSYTALVLGGDRTAPLPADTGSLVLLAAWLTNWAWLPGWLVVSTVLPQVVPEGRPLSARWWPLLAASVLLGALAVLDFATTPGPLGVFTGVDNPAAVPELADALAVLGPALDPALGVLVVLSLLSVVVRFFRADGTQRRQIGWFGYAVVMTVLVAAVGPSWAVNIAVLLVPAGLAVAAVRYRLYDLDLLVNRTLVIGLLLGGAAVVYVALVAWVGALVGTSEGAVPFLAAFAVALAFHPARVRVQRAVDRLFYGRRGDPYGLLQDLDRTLREADSPRQALAGATRLVQHGLRLPGAAVTVPLPDGEDHRSRGGVLAGELTDIPLELHGEQVGTLTVAGRSGSGRLAETDLRVLEALAGPLASAAYALRLSGDLEESRRALLDAREEERRRLRRDLHDGLGPQLAGVVMGLDAVRSTLHRGDTGRAAELTGTVAGQARTAVDDVRRLVSGLRPPVLDDLGLLGALRSSGPASVEGGPRVTVKTEGCLTDLPAAVEVAAYRIGQEAMTNAVRHARANAIDVWLEATEDAVTVRVRDDGSGISADAPRGVGIVSMRERAEELGGTLTIEPILEGGTRVLTYLLLPVKEE